MEKNPDLPKVAAPSYSSIMYLFGSYLILCDSPSKFHELFQKIEYIEGGSDIGREGYFFHLTSAFKAFTSQDSEKALHHLNEAQKKRNIKDAERTIGYEKVLLGIIQNKKRLIKNGILASIQYHTENHTVPLFSEFCLEATAMCKLAHMYGFEIDIESPFIRKDLIPHDPTIIYEDIDEVFAALQYKKPWWKLF